MSPLKKNCTKKSNNRSQVLNTHICSYGISMHATDLNGLRTMYWIIFHGYITVSTLCGNLNLSFIVWNIFVIDGFARSNDKSSADFSHLFYCIRPQTFFPSRFLEFLICFLPPSAVIPYYLLIFFTNRYHSFSSYCFLSAWFHLVSRLSNTLKSDRNGHKLSSQRLHLNPSSIYSRNSEKKVYQGLQSMSEKRNWQSEGRMKRLQ